MTLGTASDTIEIVSGVVGSEGPEITAGEAWARWVPSPRGPVLQSNTYLAPGVGPHPTPRPQKPASETLRPSRERKALHSLWFCSSYLTALFAFRVLDFPL